MYSRQWASRYGNSVSAFGTDTLMSVSMTGCPKSRPRTVGAVTVSIVILVSLLRSKRWRRARCAGRGRGRRFGFDRPMYSTTTSCSTVTGNVSIDGSGSSSWSAAAPGSLGLLDRDVVALGADAVRIEHRVPVGDVELPAVPGAAQHLALAGQLDLVRLWPVHKARDRAVAERRVVVRAAIAAARSTNR